MVKKFSYDDTTIVNTTAEKSMDILFEWSLIFLRESRMRKRNVFRP